MNEADAMRDLLGSHASVVLGTLEMMEVAERCIAEEKARWRKGPTRARVHAAFGILCPTPLFRGKAMKVFEYHCRELLARVVHKQDTRPGTKAECMLVLSETSLVVPMHSTPCALMAMLFRECFPKSEVWSGANEREQYPGAADELLAELRRKLTNDKRVVR